MTLDEELRQALTRQARTLDPAPDPLAGIERRARGIRRRRAAAAVTSTALAVLAVVGVGSALAPDHSGRSSVVATTPTPSPSPVSGALDPARPWAYRGATLDAGTLATFSRDWAARHPGSELVPLFGQVYEPSGRPELVFLGRGDEPRWGVVTSSESGSDLLLDAPLPSPAPALVAALPGDEVPRLLAVAGPEVARLSYAAGATAPERDLARLAAGVGTIALEPTDPAQDAVAGYDAQAAELFRLPAPDPAAGAPASGAPANVLDWPTRGTVDGALLLASKAGYAQSRPGTDPAAVEEKVLYAGSSPAGTRYLLAQLWLPGDKAADTVGWVDPPGNAPDPELQLKARVADGADVVALYVQKAGTERTDTLVVVPRPGTGQVLYAADGRTFRPVDMPSALDGVALVPRSPDAQSDRLQLLDGDGGAPFFDDAVFNLLCGATSCG